MRCLSGLGSSGHDRAPSLGERRGRLRPWLGSAACAHRGPTGESRLPARPRRVAVLAGRPAPRAPPQGPGRRQPPPAGRGVVARVEPPRSAGGGLHGHRQSLGGRVAHRTAAPRGRPPGRGGRPVPARRRGRRPRPRPSPPEPRPGRRPGRGRAVPRHRRPVPPRREWRPSELRALRTTGPDGAARCPHAVRTTAAAGLDRAGVERGRRRVLAQRPRRHPRRDRRQPAAVGRAR